MSAGPLPTEKDKKNPNEEYYAAEQRKNRNTIIGIVIVIAILGFLGFGGGPDANWAGY